jgi:Gas vesicle synthesis protein GvpL/GvpF
MEQDRGLLLYGVVPADVEPTADAQGVGDPPGPVQVISHNHIAALVSEVRVDQPLGRPNELRAYEQLLDGTAAVAPVLPVRFGAVLADEDAVIDLLSRYEEAFRSALDELEGRVQYAVRGRYVEEVLLTEVLNESVEAQQLREQIRQLPVDASINLRAELGELVHQAVEAKRDADTQRLVDALAPLADEVLVRPATHEQDITNLALLVETDRSAEFENGVSQLAEEWADRATLRLLGPLAPYDFVAPLEPES